MPRRIRAVVLALFLLCTGLVVAPAPAGAVIGGAVSGYGPWAVRMFVDGKPECTGTAIAQQWVLSASHCFFEQAQPIADSRITFRVGNLDVRQGRLVHPVRGSRQGSPDGADMMLIKVPRLNVPVPTLSGPADVRAGQRVRVFGWGATCTGDENACQSNRLKQAQLRVLSVRDKRCDGFGTADGRDFCATKVVGVPAGGDSGGPVFTVAPRGKEVLVGVFWGSDRASMVGVGAISHQLRWIHRVTGR